MDALKTENKISSSGRETARDRLKYILTCDRINLPTQFLEMIKGDLIRVISDYAEVDEEGIEIIVNLGKDKKESESISSLIASIPIRKVKTIVR